MVVVVANMKPAKMRDVLSSGMVRGSIFLALAMYACKYIQIANFMAPWQLLASDRIERPPSGALAAWPLMLHS